MLDPYASCPCGSGKKFKWCCQTIWPGIEKALHQDEEGQHETALRLMDEVVAANEGNPEAWGQKAALLYRNGRLEEAEAALQKAFALNPNYPFGLLLRGQFRYQEGEIPGALLLFRKAAEAYDPEAHDLLAQVYYLIFDCEMRSNRPVAGRAALRIVVHYRPGQQELRDDFEALFGEKGRLPAAARRDYAETIQTPAVSTSGRRAEWDKAMSHVSSPRLSALAQAFEEVTRADANDAAAWYDLGVARAWLGDNRGAIEALDRYVQLESDETKAGAAAALEEVLRCGQGLEEEADHKEHILEVFLRETQAPAVNNLLNDWAQARRMIALETAEGSNTFAAMLLEFSTASLVTVGGPAAEIGRLAGYVVVAGGLFRVWGPNAESFGRLRDEVRTRLALGIGEASEKAGPIQFSDVTAGALAFPIGIADKAAAQERVRNHAERYFEDTWIHKPLRSLAGNAPLDAVGHQTLRKKLRGVVQFLQDCAAGGIVSTYDFDRLRRKLGLTEGGAPPAASAQPEAGGDVGAMSAAELAGLTVDSLSDEQLERAYQAAKGLDAPELSARFAQALVARPPRADRPDRYPWYAFLIDHALREKKTDEALDLVNEGEKADCEQNEGRRRNDYELLRGRVHVKRGEADAARDTFQRLIERLPSDLRVRGAATEAMLSLRQGVQALRFAEEGLAAARQQNDRDAEQNLLELAAAAKKQIG
jgi:tetratricopeptide (TPR) repeat protein